MTRSADKGRVIEIKHRLAGETSVYECRWQARGSREGVVYYPLPGAFEFHGLSLPAGSFSFGYFWEERPYNIYHFHSPAREPLALYCNIADRTRIGEDRIEWRDLGGDVLILPSGDCRVLDEAELPAGLAPDLNTYIGKARDRLLATSGELVAATEARSRAFLSR